jgi:anti-sigma B factor antagonist
MKFSVETKIPAASSKDKSIILKIDIKGSLDANTCQEFNFIINTIINGGAKKIILDIDGLQYIDSTGIGSLITVAKKIRKENGDLAVTRYTSQIMAILKPINIGKFIEFFPTIEDGYNYLNTV